MPTYCASAFAISPPRHSDAAFARLFHLFRHYAAFSDFFDTFISPRQKAATPHYAEIADYMAEVISGQPHRSLIIKSHDSRAFPAKQTGHRDTSL